MSDFTSVPSDYRNHIYETVKLFKKLTDCFPQTPGGWLWSERSLELAVKHSIILPPYADVHRYWTGIDALRNQIETDNAKEERDYKLELKPTGISTASPLVTQASLSVSRPVQPVVPVQVNVAEDVVRTANQLSRRNKLIAAYAHIAGVIIAGIDSGTYTYSRMAAALNQQGLSNHEGKPFVAKVVADIYRRAKGLTTYHERESRQATKVAVTTNEPVVETPAIEAELVTDGEMPGHLLLEQYYLKPVEEQTQVQYHSYATEPTGVVVVDPNRQLVEVWSDELAELVTLAESATKYQALAEGLKAGLEKFTTEHQTKIEEYSKLNGQRAQRIADLESSVIELQGDLAKSRHKTMRYRGAIDEVRSTLNKVGEY